MLDENFMDLVWWVVLPLAALYALYALHDCCRATRFRPFEKVAWAIVIILFPVGGGVLWFRAKDRRRAADSSLMRRVRKRHGLG